MGRLSLFFALALMMSALSLVTARFQSRQLFVLSGQLEDKAQQLDTDWRRLQLERAEVTRNARIDAVARGELNMMPPPLGRTIYLKGDLPTSMPAPGGQP